MFRLLLKSYESLRANGLARTIAKSLRYLSPQSVNRRRLYRRMLTLADAEQRFSAIYDANLWAGDESASGTGSSLEYTANLRQRLPQVFDQYGIKVLLDAPCGDFHWMRGVLNECLGIRYIGGDIVESLVERNTRAYANDSIAFQTMDITRDDLPACDLMLVRDCLFHLSYADISRFLDNLSRSDVRYLLTTSHIFDAAHQNRDIVTGDFRPLDIFRPPLYFPPRPLLRIDDWMKPDMPRQMCLFDVKGLPAKLVL